MLLCMYLLSKLYADFFTYKNIQSMYIPKVFINNMKILKASNFQDLSKAPTISSEVTTKAPTVQSKSPPAKKPAKAKAVKKEPYERASFTLTSEHILYIDNLVQAQRNDGLNSNQSHVLRQLLTAEIKRNSK